MVGGKIRGYDKEAGNRNKEYVSGNAGGSSGTGREFGDGATESSFGEFPLRPSLLCESEAR
jgi:hypothetical protein